jgi:hypothetical protein
MSHAPAARNVIILSSFFCSLCVGLVVSVFTVAVSDETDAVPSLTIDFDSSYRSTSRKLALIIVGTNFVISVFNWMMVNFAKDDTSHCVFLTLPFFRRCATTIT